MPSIPSQEIMRKRLGNINSTQEAVQTCSKWVLHHRESIDKVANCWMEIYKTANEKLRTSLIYVLNDVVQKAAAKRDINVTLTFHPHLINATTISSLDVKKAISRCVEVFEQRNVYPPHIIEEMKSALVTNIKTEKAAAIEDTQGTGEIDFPQLVRGIESYYKNEMLTEKAREILSRSSFNFKESVQARVKDREEGIKALAEMDTSKAKLVTFLESVQNHQQKGQKLLQMIKQAQGAFNLQLRDVIVVNDAYDKFFEGIRETKQQLDIIDSSGMALGESPPRDAPSPTANDDPFMHGVDGEELNGGGDDMEMDDEDKPGTSRQCFLKPPKEYAAQMPMAMHHQDMDPRIQRVGMRAQPQIGGQMHAVMDPRQARFFQQQQPPSLPTNQIPMPPPMNVPPPGLSPPPDTQTNSSAEGGSQMSIIDTSQPPPQFFNGGGELSPPGTMFNPANPPPQFPTQNMMSSPPPSLFKQQISTPPNFKIPPPGLVHPPPLFQQQQHFGPHGPGQIGGGGPHQKRRNTAESDNFRSKRGRNNDGRNNDGGGWHGGESRRGGWRRSFDRGEAGRFRH